MTWGILIGSGLLTLAAFFLPGMLFVLAIIYDSFKVFVASIVSLLCITFVCFFWFVQEESTLLSLIAAVFIGAVSFVITIACGYVAVKYKMQHERMLRLTMKKK